MIRRNLLLCILVLIVLLNCRNNNEENKISYFNDYQIELSKNLKYENKIYSLAFQISGSHDKVIFLELYPTNIEGKIHADEIYIKPLFSIAIDQKWDDEDKPTRNPVDADINFQKQEIIILFDNNEKEVIKFVDYNIILPKS